MSVTGRMDLDALMPAQPAGPGGGIDITACALCGNPGHVTQDHALLEALNRGNELLAVIGGVLEPKRYRLIQETTEDGNGRAACIFDQWPGGVDKLFLIERMIFFNAGAASAVATTYIQEGIGLPTGRSAANSLQLPILNARDSVDQQGISGLSGGVPGTSMTNVLFPIPIKGAETMIVQWTGLNVGSAARVGVRVQFRQSWQSPD